MEYDSSAWTGRKPNPYPIYINIHTENFLLYFGFGVETCHRLELAICFTRRKDRKEGEFIYKYRFIKRWFSLRGNQ